MKGRKIRLDQLLVERGLTQSREKAQSLIMAGAVLVNGQKSEKPGKTLEDDVRIEVLESCPYVGRGGYKLAAALEEFHIDPRDRICLDVGASTGGFTDCLLQNGAKRVYAFDVGTAQLDWKIRNDPRVVVRESYNVRYMKPEDIPEKVSLFVCDVSFISVTLILPAVVPVMAEDGEMAILIKPQFEAGRDQVGRGGIIRDPLIHKQVVDRIVLFVEQQLQLKTAVIPSPILGAEGNQEFLLHAHH